MRLRTLGGLALEGVPFTRPKPLLLLAYLALEGPQERRRLAELFWPAATDPRKSLTVALSQLRRGAPGTVQADRRRLWTTCACDAVDLLERLARGERDETPAQAGAFLDGLDVPNLGVELEEWVFGTREVVAARILQARLDRGERAAAEGRLREAAAHAHEAMELFSTAVEPQDLVRLHTLLLAAGSPLARRARDEVEGYGIELANTSEAARRRLSANPRPTPTGPATRLPKRSTSFVGRDRERKELGALLARSGGGLVTLMGPAGVGKSRLALEVASAQRRLGTFPGGVHFVPLAPLHTSGAIPGAILESLGVTPEPSLQPLDQAARAIGEGEVLLVCDGLEHLMDGVAHLATLAGECPRLRVLLTSPERANVEREQVFEVTGLAYPSAAEVQPGAALRSDAIRLFLQRAARARPGFALADGELDQVVRVCRLVEGLPLGIELAASWVRVMPVAEIADAIEHDIGILASDARDAPEHHRSVRAAFERSWALLSDRERRVMRRLSVFRGGFRRPAAGAVTGATIATLASLVDKSLLRSSASGRFTRHTLVYQFTQQKLSEDAQEAAEATARHASYYLSLLRDKRVALAGGGKAPRQQAALDVIEEERENIRSALASVAADADPIAYAEAVEALSAFFEARSRAREGVAFFRERSRWVAQSSSSTASVRALLVAQARLLRCSREHGEATEREWSAGERARRRAPYPRSGSRPSAARREGARAHRAARRYRARRHRANAGPRRRRAGP
jgi:predicted ATPase